MATPAKNEGLINTVNDIIEIAKAKKIVHLYTEDEAIEGAKITIDKSQLINFGSCSYLGLEQDKRLLASAHKAIDQYGTQYSSSRTYVSTKLYAELEELLCEIFGPYMILSTSSSMAHQAVMPIVIGGNDALIYDQQAHVSMQEMSYKLRHNGTEITVCRHNHMKQLEALIQEYSVVHDKVWYAIDGVYSMYGDYPFTNDLHRLLNKYPKFHLYVDDAHGMSWAGEHGAGYFLSKMKMHAKMVFCTSLAKGFGSAGGVTVFPNEEMYQRVRNWGGPLTYSGPQQPGTIGASIAAAKIHLSEEINQLQDDLAERVSYCQTRLQDAGLPIVSTGPAPVLFLGLGLPRVGYNMIERLKQDGLYVNLGIFPAVPEACTGMRWTITNHHTKQHLDKLVDAISHHLPLAFAEEKRSAKDLKRAFKRVADVDQWDDHAIEKAKSTAANQWQVLQYRSINEIDPFSWNKHFGGKGIFDYCGLQMLESVFDDAYNSLENQWSFDYIRVNDQFGNTIVDGLITTTIMKDDLLSPQEISEIAEQERRAKNDPFHLTSKCLMLGTPLSDGDHLFVDRSHAQWEQAMSVFMDTLHEMQEKYGAKMILNRDFEADDKEIQTFFQGQGYVKIPMPSRNVLSLEGISDRLDFLASLKAKRRQQLRRDVLAYENQYQSTVDANHSAEELYNLYLQVKSRNLSLNTFDLPLSLFKAILANDCWQIIYTYFEGQLASFVAAYRQGGMFCPVVIGMNGNLQAPNLYKQTMYQTILKAIAHRCDKVYLGMTAAETKKGFGCEEIESVGFIQLKDHFNANYLGLLKAQNVKKVKVSMGAESFSEIK